MGSLYWQPKDSPLRREVEDLWVRRKEGPVHKTLKPFLKDTFRASTTTSEKLLFHMAVMRWKYSLLTPSQQTAVQNWIHEEYMLKEKVQIFPWSEEACKHGDHLFAENTYIQR